MSCSASKREDHQRPGPDALPDRPLPLPDPQEMALVFQEVPEALTNTCRIGAERCDVQLNWGNTTRRLSRSSRPLTPPPTLNTFAGKDWPGVT